MQYKNSLAEPIPEIKFQTAQTDTISYSHANNDILLQLLQPITNVSPVNKLPVVASYFSLSVETRRRDDEKPQALHILLMKTLN